MAIISQQCLRYSGEERALEVLRSNAGYYLGTTDDLGCPNSRDSGYYPTSEAAQAALDSGEFVPRLHP